MVEYHAKSYNEVWKEKIHPSNFIWVEKSVWRWYGMGGNSIHGGLPHDIVIDRKPYNGCEIQNYSHGSVCAILRLKLVKTAEEEKTHKRIMVPAWGPIQCIVVIKLRVLVVFLSIQL